jgi:hypothetical protein
MGPRDLYNMNSNIAVRWGSTAFSETSIMVTVNSDFEFTQGIFIGNSGRDLAGYSLSPNARRFVLNGSLFDKAPSASYYQASGAVVTVTSSPASNAVSIHNQLLCGTYPPQSSTPKPTLLLSSKPSFTPADAPSPQFSASPRLTMNRRAQLLQSNHRCLPALPEKDEHYLELH